jgi:hypothetical protein
MTRREIFLIIPLMSACSRPQRSFSDVLPERLETWQRGNVEKLAEIPPMVSELGVEEAAQTTYTGQGTLRVHAYRMKAETSAFEVIQKWRQHDGLAAYKGPHFFVVQHDGSNAGAVVHFLRLLQSAVQ